MLQQVQDAVDGTIAAATVDLEAAAGERVRFAPEQLDAIDALFHDVASRERVLHVTRQRLDAAIMALEPAGSDLADWHDAHAALALLIRLEAAGSREGGRTEESG